MNPTTPFVAAFAKTVAKIEDACWGIVADFERKTATNRTEADTRQMHSRVAKATLVGMLRKRWTAGNLITEVELADELGTHLDLMGKPPAADEAPAVETLRRTRRVRQMVFQLRNDHALPIIAVADRNGVRKQAHDKGYRLALTVEEVRAYLKSDRKRAMSAFKSSAEKRQSMASAISELEDEVDIDGELIGNIEGMTEAGELAKV